MRLPSILIGLSCWLLGSSLAWANVLESIRVEPESSQTRVVIDFEDKPNFSHFLITESKPVRLVIDIEDTDLVASLPQKITNSDVLTKVRPSRPAIAKSFRLVFELKNEIQPLFIPLNPAGESGHRLVVNLPHQASTTMVSQAAQQVLVLPTAQVEPKAKPSSTPAPSVKTMLPFGQRDVIVAIDPGHGGNDPGAIGPRRKYEKHVTLSVAQRLVRLINGVKGMKAVLTRTGDYYVGLNKRYELARDFEADFLVSIHADGFSSPEPRGASVLLLSNSRKNSEVSRMKNKPDQQSELVGAGEILTQTDDEYLKQSLLDMLSRNSNEEGEELAKEILKELGKVTKLHKQTPQNASLAVLSAIDIPSVLVEAGFITNPQEEKLLQKHSYQEKIAKAIYRGIRRYAESTAPDGTLLAAKKNGVKHTVSYGESLSVIAQKYGVSIRDIMRNNDLSSEVVQVDQELVIFHASKQSTRLRSYSNRRQHTVQNGDYLGKIAGSYDVSIEQLRTANRLNSDELKIGQVLIIPGS